MHSSDAQEKTLRRTRERYTLSVIQGNLVAIRQKPLIVIIVPLVTVFAGLTTLILLQVADEYNARNKRNCFLSQSLELAHSLDAAQESIHGENLDRLTLLASSNPPWSKGFTLADNTSFKVLLSLDDQILAISGIATYWDSRRSGSYWTSSIAIWEIHKQEDPICFLIPNKGPRDIEARGISADNRFVLVDQYGKDDALGECKGIRCTFVYDRIANQELEYKVGQDYDFKFDQGHHGMSSKGTALKGELCAHDRVTDVLLLHFVERLKTNECLTEIQLNSDKKFVVVTIETRVESAKYGRIEIWGIAENQ